MPPNWSMLVEQNRAKAFGLPWSEQELEAIVTLKIPPEFVRRGILTLKDYEKAQAGNVNEKKYKKLDELRSEATELGIPFASETTRLELIELIEVKKEVNSTSGNTDVPPVTSDQK